MPQTILQVEIDDRKLLELGYQKLVTTTEYADTIQQIILLSTLSTIPLCFTSSTNEEGLETITYWGYAGGDVALNKEDPGMIRTAPEWIVEALNAIHGRI